MATRFHRLLWLPLIAALAMLSCWKFGKSLDRLAFSLLAHGTANPPFFVSGDGTHKDPWALRTLSQKIRPDKNYTPFVVSLGNDTNGFFQGSPHSPVDLAVVLGNFHRLGAKQAACGVILAWEEPDPIGLLALENQLDKFNSLITAAPLARGAVPSSIPLSFRRASLATADAHGDIGALPTVNRISIPGVILGGENVLSGFTHIDTENLSNFPQILARWDDRLVFSFHFLAALQRIKVSLEDVEIRIGQYIKLGDSGKIMLIDHFGRLPLDLAGLAAMHEIPAESLIDAPNIDPSLISKPWILRDDRSAMESAMRKFSASIVPNVTAIASEAGLTKPVAKNRLDRRVEFVLLGNVWLILIAVARLPMFGRNIGYLLLAGLCIASQFIASGLFSIWLPGTIALSGIASAWMVSLSFLNPPQPVLPAPFAPSPPIKPARKVAKKATAKKAATKKVPAKKTAAKKTTRSRKPKSSS